MKIVPHQPVASPTAALSAAPDAPAQPFADFLADPALPGDRPRERAFGFCELGVFGVARSVDAASALPAGPRRAEPASPGSAQSRFEQLGAPSDAELQAQNGQPSSAVQRTAATEASIHVRPHRISTEAPRGTPAADGAPVAAAAPEDFADSSASGPAGAARPSRLPPPRSGGTLSLVIIREDGRLQLIAGGPDLDDRSRAALRRSAEAIASEFGFSLSRLTVNGEPLNPLPTIFRRL
jgi:hypothetical protein